MGKNLISQKRGKGTSVYKAHSFKYVGEVKHHPALTQKVDGKIIDLVHSAGHYAPIAKVSYADGSESLQLAPHGVKVGDIISTGPSSEVKDGNTLPLTEIPDGTLIYNIELLPGDGGKLVRSSGGFARVTAHNGDKVHVVLPSKREKVFEADCRATVGVIAGGGRPDKPLLTAGNAFKKAGARGKLYPRTSAVAMNAVSHPFGGSSSSTKGRPLIARRHAPAGAKVGALRPKRTGRGKK